MSQVLNLKLTNADLKVFENHLSQAALTDDNVLIVGEHNSGQLDTAIKIHHLSDRSRGRFQKIDCTGLSPEQFIYQLCGNQTKSEERGKAGIISQCHRGVLCVIGVNELSEQAQAVLLRLIHEQEYFPVGALEPVKCDVRIISIPSKPLAALVDSGAFRFDLYASLSKQIIAMPSYSEATDNLETIINAKLKKLCFKKISLTANASNYIKQSHVINSFSKLDCLLSNLVTLTTTDVIDESDVINALSLLNKSIATDTFKKLNTDMFNAQSIENRRLSDSSSSRRTDTDTLVNDSASTPVSIIRQKRRATDKPMTLKENERFYWLNLLDTLDNDKEKAAKVAGVSVRTLYRRLDSVGLS